MGCRGFLVGCLGIIIIIAIIVVGGFFAFQRGMITQTTILNLVGRGPGDIEVDNFADNKVEVTIKQLDVSKDSSPNQGTLSLNAFDIKSFRAQDPGKYKVDFGKSSGGTDLGTCTLTVKSGDRYQFVTLPDKIVVNRANNPPSAGKDLIVATSALCR